MKRGEVVYIDWPYSDRTGSKIRPAVVVQADFLNARIADTVLVLISRTSRAARSTEVLLDPAVETRSGLHFVSVASCNNFMTTDQGLVERTVGELSAAAIQRIEAAVKVALAIP